MKILLIRNDNLGDLINTTPAIEALRKKYPKAQIDILVNSYNYLAIKNNPYVNKIYIYTKSKHVKNISTKLKVLLEKMVILKDIFAQKYNICIVFRSHYSSSATLFAKVSMAKTKIGVGDYFNNQIKFNDAHEAIFCFKCLEPLQVKQDQDNEKTFFYIDKKLIEKYKNHKNKILFHISSRLKENQISKEKFKKIFDMLKKDIIFTAEPNDIQNAKWLGSNTDATFIPTKSLEELAGIIKNVKLFISLDGGALHIGPAVGTKTIALFGKTDINRWYPWGYKDLVLQDESKIAEKIDNDRIIDIIRKNL